MSNDILSPLMQQLSLPQLVALILAGLVVTHVLAYASDRHGMRNVPGPWFAKFSDAWLGWVAAKGHRSEVVHDLHKQYGTFVRLAPNHTSISDPDALHVVYAHGNGTLKSDFYDAFVSVHRGLFNTRNRSDHARKRKIVSAIFSQKNVIGFEPHVREYVGQLIKQWDRLCAEAQKDGARGNEGEGGWKGRQGRLWLDCLPWFNYLAFDIIGDLAFGQPFGMLSACKDSAPVALSHEEAMSSYGSSAARVIHIPAVQILNDRGEYSASMGVLPPSWRPLVKTCVPWYRKGSKAVKNLAGLAVAAVAARMDRDAKSGGTDRQDLLTKLQEGTDDEGKPMGREELTAEALTQLIAGSDTTSNSSCAVTYYLAANPSVQRKLQAELDEALSAELDPVSTFDQVKNLKYLQAVIDETLRIHSTSGIGLSRIVPEGSGGMHVSGRWFPEGAVLSVPSYTIHRDEEVWGADPDAFRPERWFEQDEQAIQKTFNPFSFGPRACVGRNLASMELLIIISSVLRRYDFVLEHPEKPLDTREGFLRKPLECKVGIRKRQTI